MKEREWYPYIDNLKKAMAPLSGLIARANLKSLNQHERQGLLREFQFAYQASINLLSAYFKNQGKKIGNNPKESIREAYYIDLISDHIIWTAMSESNNAITNSNEEHITEPALIQIIKSYVPLLEIFLVKMTGLMQGEQKGLF